MGAFYEIESISPAKELKTGESLGHRHRTIHIQADMETLRKLAKEMLGVDLDAVRKAMHESAGQDQAHRVPSDPVHSSVADGGTLQTQEPHTATRSSA